LRAAGSGSADRLKADLALVAVTAVWGATFFMIKDALLSVTPFWFMVMRFSLAALLLAPFLRGGPWQRADIWAGIIVGVLLFLGYALQTIGLQLTGAARAGFITGLAVLFVPLAQALSDRAWPGRATLAGVCASLTGLALLSLGALDAGLMLVGDALVLGCAVAFSGHILALGRFAPRVAPVQLTFVPLLTTAALSLALASNYETSPSIGFVDALPAVIFTATFATVGAFYVQTRAQRFTSPTHTALIFALEPVFAALFATMLGGERLSVPELLGCGLILAGMLAMQLER
jgi:drug/metabolite transporter (DMT)-like permease